MLSWMLVVVRSPEGDLPGSPSRPELPAWPCSPELAVASSRSVDVVELNPEGASNESCPCMWAMAKKKVWLVCVFQ